MEINFSNIKDHIIPMDDFVLKWRFTGDQYNVLPNADLDLINPLSKEAAKFLSDFLRIMNLHQDVPFKKGFFRVENETYDGEGCEDNVKAWLNDTGVIFSKEVFLSYSQDTAAIVPFEVLVKYFPDFSYADDLTVFEENLDWALLFFHEGQIYWGTDRS